MLKTLEYVKYVICDKILYIFYDYFDYFLVIEGNKSFFVVLSSRYCNKKKYNKNRGRDELYSEQIDCVYVVIGKRYPVLIN